MKTIREWLDELPDGYRERALRNAEPAWKIRTTTLIGALNSGFTWQYSPEGHAFWAQVSVALSGGTFPEIP